MKKLFAFLFVALIVSIHACAETTPKHNDYSMIDGVGRGFANILVGWLELPRGITYYAVEYPVIGIVPGAFEGSGMTFIRAIGGLIDIVTVGYLEPGNTVYDTMDTTLYPWQAPWLPEKEKEIQ